MTIVKKKTTRIVLSITALLLLITVGLGTFFVSNDPPILNGEVLYQILYKEGRYLDIYRPTQNSYTKSPVLLYFHGGAWVTGRKEAINVNRYNDAINNLRQNGYTIITPEYTLADGDQSPFPRCIIDAYDALHWVKQHADEYQLDINNIGLFGESAGAHIAMMTAYSQMEDFEVGDSIPAIHYVIDVYGPTDLGLLYEYQTMDSLNSVMESVPNTIVRTLNLTEQVCGFNPRKDSIRAQDFMNTYSPLRRIAQEVPPTLIIQGDSDLIVPYDQSDALRQKFEALEIGHEFHELKGVGHAFRGASKSQKDSVQNWIVEFVKRHYQS